MTARFTVDGIKVSLLGYGAMRLPTVDGGTANNWALDSSKKPIDQRHLNRQVRRMLEKGVNYFDTSPAYCRGESEAALGEALVSSGRGRGEYIIATKLSNFAPTTWSLGSCKSMFERSLKALRTDYVDNYLLHSIGNGGFATFSKRYIENGAADWCLELRAQRRIRNLGFSFHGDKKAFDWCLENHGKYKWDFCQIQMNYVDWRHARQVNSRNVDAKTLYDELTALKIPVVVMEPLLGGRLARYNWALANELTPLDPEASLAKWSFRFCGSFDNVMTILSGMTLDEHIEENVATFSPLRKCTPEEFAALERAAEAYLSCNAIPCNSCNYCMPCPYGLDIPTILTFRNQHLAKGGARDPRGILWAYAKAVPEELRRADHCTGCGRCSPHCPQQIDIPREIATIDAAIDVLKAETAR
ncbi:MAG: aldo/keto reductase [Kiritimatiellae bacterium]|nr:aldo/keto reductase [Kiritimatiellia bacterium]